MQDSKDQADLDKPIYGAAAIAEALNITERQAYYAIHSGQLKVGKFLGRHTSTLRQLREQALGSAA